ncbi:MAG: hypothetical protein LBJ02_00820 [Bifidobacteriaceae bacterium]|nr:hypothetical protein [Bifidobacteriaceae bacterium]
MAEDGSAAADGGRGLFAIMGRIARKWGRAARAVPRWIWPVACLPVALLIGGGIYQAATTPNLAAVREAVAPYSRGTEGCVERGGTNLGRPWFGGAREAQEEASRFSAQNHPHKVRVDPQLLQNGDTQTLVLMFYVCDG